MKNLTAENLKHLIKNQSLFKQVKLFDTINSTNSYAKQNATSYQTALFIANEQTAGRGRLGRVWSSSKEDGLYFSMLLRPTIKPEVASMLTQVAAVAMSRAIKEVSSLETQIKWPNDIIYNNKKLCGILTEMATDGKEIQYVVVGVGLNVNQATFDEELLDIATSLNILLNKKISRYELIEAFINAFIPLYEKFLIQSDLSFVVDELNKKSTIVGQDIIVFHQDNRYHAKATIINELGELEIIDEFGNEDKLCYGEVSVRKLR